MPNDGLSLPEDRQISPIGGRSPLGIISATPPPGPRAPTGLHPTAIQPTEKRRCSAASKAGTQEFEPFMNLGAPRPCIKRLVLLFALKKERLGGTPLLSGA